MCKQPECDTKWLPRKQPVKKWSLTSRVRLVRFLLRAQNFECFYCEEFINFNEATRDHFFPKSHGYALVYNTVISCERCNKAKGNIIPGLDAIMKAWILYESINLKLHSIKHLEISTECKSQWDKLVSAISDDGLIFG